MALVSSGVEPQPNLAWTFESSNVDYVTNLSPSAQVSPGPAQLVGSASLVTTVAGVSNTAVYFPGTAGSYMNLGTSSPTEFNIGSSNLFVETWMYINSVPTNYAPIIANGPTGLGSSQENWGLQFVAFTATPAFFSNNKVVASTITPSLGTWVHVAASYNTLTSTAYIFVNGAAAGSVSGVITRFRTGITVIGIYPQLDTSQYSNMYIRDLRVVQGGVVPVATFTPLAAAPFSYASPTYVANMGTTVFTLLGQFVTYNPSGKYNTSLVMGGTSYLKFSKTLGYDLGTGGATFAMWFKLLAIPTGNFWIFGASGTSYNDRIYISVGTNGTIGWTFIDNTLVGKVLTSPSALVVGAWTHLAFTLFNGTMTMYVNGTQVATRSDAPMSGVVLDTQFSFAALAGGSAQNINAEYDDLRIYNTALTSSQVQSVYSSQGAPAPSRAMPLPRLAWDFNGTTADYVSGVIPVSSAGFSYTAGKYNQASSFTNTVGSAPTNYIVYDFTPISSAAFTVCCWVKTVVSAGTGIAVSIRGNNPEGDVRIVIGGSSPGNVLVQYNTLNAPPSTYTYYNTTSATNSVVAGVWNHVAVTITESSVSGTVSSCFFNGSLASTATSAYGAPRNLYGVGVGAFYSLLYNNGFNGSVDDLRIFDRALTSAQVQAIYNQQGVPGRGVTSKVVPTFTVSDQSQNPLTLSTYGSATSNTNSPFGGTEGSIENLYYNIPSSVSKTNFSFWGSNCFIEFWMYLSGTNSGNPRIIERGNYPNSEYSVYMNASSGGYYLKFAYGTNFPFAFQFVPGTWNHFSISYNYATQTLYGSINGSVANGGTTAGITYNSGSSVNLYPSGSGYVIDISNLRVVTGATTLPYITNGFTVPTAPLSIYPTGTTALLLRSVSPLTMFSGGAIQSATGGNTVQDIGGYRIHTFTTVGTSTFTPASAGNVEVLVVAGGGSGGMRHAGGGGAGGLIYNSSFPVSGAVSVTVGDGGAGLPQGTNASVPGNSGANSVFGSLTAIGGGYGNQGNGGSGGSGGGTFNSTVGTGTAGQGNNGAFGSTGPFTGENAYGGGGGGGAGAPGTASTSVAPVNAGAGGIGRQISISGTPTYYAGGGGGGTTTAVGGGAGGAGGLGGGGAGGGSNSIVGIAGINGTGGGGGCGGFSNAGGNFASGKGGSGIVIVRYPLPVRLTGAPLFNQLSQAARSSAVGAFSLRAVNGTTAKAVAVQAHPIVQWPPAAMNNNTTNFTGQPYGNGNYTASTSVADGFGANYQMFDYNDATTCERGANAYNSTTGAYLGSNSTTISSVSVFGEWFQIALPTTMILRSYRIVSRTDFFDRRNPTTFWIAGSNNGTDWSNVNQQSGLSYPASGITITVPTTSNSIAYSYYRMVVNTIGVLNLNTGRNIVDINTWDLFGDAPSYAPNASQDFYADRLGNLLTAPVTGQSLANWLGGATGYVTTWYNQIQPGQDVSATVAANQPTIDPVNKTIVFNGSTHSFSNTSTTGGLLAACVGTGTKYTYTASWNKAAGSGTGRICEHNSLTFTGNQASALIAFGTVYGFNGEGNDAHYIAPLTLGTQVSTVMRLDNTNSTNLRVRSNGADYSGSTGNYATLSLNNYWFVIGRKASNNSEFFNGTIKNVMVFRDAISDADTAVLDAWQQSL